jgi:ABC-type dipeptide/oligopeptide/nickel transport system permease subunit
MEQQTRLSLPAYAYKSVLGFNLFGDGLRDALDPRETPR